MRISHATLALLAHTGCPLAQEARRESKDLEPHTRYDARIRIWWNPNSGNIIPYLTWKTS